MPYLQRAIDRPFGFMPAGGSQRLRAYNKDVAAARIFPGDVVMREADGNVAVITAGNETNILGVSAEPSANATADTEVMVYDDPEQEFVCQDDGAGGFFAQTSEGLNADIVVTTGDTTLDRSQHELDISSAVTTIAPLKIVRLHPVETGFATAAGSPRRVIVKFNPANHIYATTAGI